MSIRKLTLVENKTLSESDKTELAGFLSTFDKQTKQLASSDDRLTEALTRVDNYKSLFAMYEHCITDIVYSMVDDVYKAEDIIKKYKEKWQLNNIKVFEEED